MDKFNIILFALAALFVIISSIKPQSSSEEMNISDFGAESFQD